MNHLLKRVIVGILSVFASAYTFGQSQGITYQAIIIDQQVKEIPGVDVEGSYLPDRPLTVRFSILNQTGGLDYQEDHNTRTDDYGMINLVIGQGTTTGGSPGTFMDIDWDGTPKDLRVEVSIGEATSDFLEFSYQQLTFVPYAYHRNITATGDLTVSGQSTFNGEVEFQDITVQGETNLNGDLLVNNGSSTILSGNLMVDGTSVFEEITILGPSTLNNTLTVNAATGLNGQVTINADVNGNDSNYDAYPLRVEGSNQGIAVRIDGNRNNSNNFVTFWDGSGGIQGRIEGQTTSEVFSEPEYIFDHVIFGLKTVAQIANTATAIAAAIADPGNAIIEGVNAATLIAEIAEYEIFAFSNLGVTYESGSGDYAEWLPKLDPTEELDFGLVVGVFGGKVTKKTAGAEMLLVISRSPIVLGNMPAAGADPANYVKVGFMGQVPVWVSGNVNPGDYILPSGANNGVAMAKSPAAMELSDYKNIVGVAWTSTPNPGLHLVNVAIGLNANDISGVVVKQQEEIAGLKRELVELRAERNQMNDALTRLVPGYSDLVRTEKPVIQPPTSNIQSDNPNKHSSAISQASNNTSSPVVTREHIVKSIEIIRQSMDKQGIDPSRNPVLNRMESDPAYREEVISRVMKMVAINSSGPRE